MGDEPWYENTVRAGTKHCGSGYADFGKNVNIMDDAAQVIGSGTRLGSASIIMLRRWPSPKIER